MKHLVKLFVVTFICLICTYSFAEQKIVFVDMNYVLNNSKAGKGAQDYLKKTIKDSQKYGGTWRLERPSLIYWWGFRKKSWMVDWYWIVNKHHNFLII